MVSFNLRSSGELLQILPEPWTLQESKQMQDEENMLEGGSMQVRSKLLVLSQSAKASVRGLGILYFHGDTYKMDSSFQQGVILVISSHIFLCTLGVHIKRFLSVHLSINSRTDLGVGPGGPSTPFCPLICFSFVNVRI